MRVEGDKGFVRMIGENHLKGYMVLGYLVRVCIMGLDTGAGSGPGVCIMGV